MRNSSTFDAAVQMAESRQILRNSSPGNLATKLGPWTAWKAADVSSPPHPNPVFAGKWTRSSGGIFDTPSPTTAQTHPTSTRQLSIRSKRQAQNAFVMLSAMLLAPNQTSFFTHLEA